MWLFWLFQTIIGPNGSNYDSEMSHVSGVVPLKKMSPPFYRHFFHNCFRRLRGDIKRDEQHDASDKNHRWAISPAGSGNGVNTWFLVG